MAVGDIVQVKWRYLVNSQNVLNVIAFKDLDAAHTITQLAADLWSSANGLAVLMNNMRNSVVTQDLTVEYVVPHGPAGIVYSAAAPPTGLQTLGAGGELLPPQSAQVLTWRTALAGRSYRGRTYLSGYGTLEQVGGVWTAGHMTSINGQATAFLARYNAATGVYAHWGLCVISRQLNGVVRVTPVGTDVTAYQARSTVYTQRRREVGVGI